MLDPEELLYLAAYAGASGNAHEALLHLNELLQREPKHAKALYLRGVQHAQLGLFDKGIAGMMSALTIEPGLELARFQLGVLLLDRNRLADAKQHLTLLHASADRALSLYSQALVAIVDDDRERAREKIAQGLAEKSRNQGLVSMMARLHAALDPSTESESETEQNSASEHDPVHLGAYRQASG